MFLTVTFWIVTHGSIRSLLSPMTIFFRSYFVLCKWNYLPSFTSLFKWAPYIKLYFFEANLLDFYLSKAQLFSINEVFLSISKEWLNKFLSFLSKLRDFSTTDFLMITILIFNYLATSSFRLFVSLFCSNTIYNRANIIWFDRW